MLIYSFAMFQSCSSQGCQKRYKTGDAEKSTTRESQEQETNCKEVNITSIFPFVYV